MIGIKEIGVHIPKNKSANSLLRDKFDFTSEFLENKIGVKQRAVKDPKEKTSDLCLKAYSALTRKINIHKDQIDLMIVVTQNPDTAIPHCSGILHGLLDLPESCAAFDISLGCSGYVYALSIVESFMRANGMKKALLFTCDPYSEIIDPDDKNTVLLFGDGATATYVTEKPVFVSGKYCFGSMGKKANELTLNKGKLYMNGSAIVKFAAKTVPANINELLRKNQISLESVDSFLFHQGSKFIVDIIKKNLALPNEKVPFSIADYGNTVSSSIPILLEKELKSAQTKKVVLSGFGVGLSWGSALLYRPRPGK